MIKTKDQIAATVLGWVLMPLALVDLLVLLIACFQPRWYLPMVLGALLYQVPALVIWWLLVLVAYSKRSLRFIRITWGAHVVFNIAASLLWIGNALDNRDAFPTDLWPLAVTLPVLITAGYFLCRTFISNSKQT